MELNQTATTQETERLTLALIAHDSKKEDLVYFAKSHRDELGHLNLIATKDTGQRIRSRTTLEVTLLETGRMGGEHQIASLVVSGTVNAIILLRDPLRAKSDEPDVNALQKVCDIHDVPLATNLTSAEATLHLMVHHPDIFSGSYQADELMPELMFQSASMM